MKRILIPCCLVLCLFSCKTKEEKDSSGKITFTLNGTATGFENNTRIYLDYSASDLIDSTFIVDNKFSFNGVLADSMAAKVILHTKGFDDYKYLWVAPGDITIAVEKGSFRKGIVTGSPVQAEDDEDAKKLEPFYQSLDSISAALRTPGADTTLLRKKQSEVLKKIEQENIAYIRSNPGSLISADKLAGHRKEWDRDLTQELYEVLWPEVQQSPDGKEVEHYLRVARPIAIGDTLKDIRFSRPDGKEIKLEDYRGKVVLLEFWASWCIPCREQNPELVKLYNDLHSKGLEIIFFSRDENLSNWHKAMEKDGIGQLENINTTHGQNKDIPDIFNINSLPASFLLDGNGILVGKGLRDKALRDGIMTALSTKSM